MKKHFWLLLVMVFFFHTMSGRTERCTGWELKSGTTDSICVRITDYNNWPVTNCTIDSVSVFIGSTPNAILMHLTTPVRFTNLQQGIYSVVLHADTLSTYAPVLYLEIRPDTTGGAVDSSKFVPVYDCATIFGDYTQDMVLAIKDTIDHNNDWNTATGFAVAGDSMRLKIDAIRMVEDTVSAYAASYKADVSGLAVPGSAMTLTTGERQAVADSVEAQLLNTTNIARDATKSDYQATTTIASNTGEIADAVQESLITVDNIARDATKDDYKADSTYLYLSDIVLLATAVRDSVDSLYLAEPGDEMTLTAGEIAAITAAISTEMELTINVARDATKDDYKATGFMVEGDSARIKIDDKIVLADITRDSVDALNLAHQGDEMDLLQATIDEISAELDTVSVGNGFIHISSIKDVAPGDYAAIAASYTDADFSKVAADQVRYRVIRVYPSVTVIHNWTNMTAYSAGEYYGTFLVPSSPTLATYSVFVEAIKDSKTAGSATTFRADPGIAVMRRIIR